MRTEFHCLFAAIDLQCNSVMLVLLKIYESVLHLSLTRDVKMQCCIEVAHHHNIFYESLVPFESVMIHCKYGFLTLQSLVLYIALDLAKLLLSAQVFMIEPCSL